MGEAEAGRVARRLATVITGPSVRADIASLYGCGGLCRRRGASVREDSFLKKCKITVVSLRQVALVFDKAVGFRRVSNRVVGGRRQDLLQDSGVIVSSSVDFWCYAWRMLCSRMLQRSRRYRSGPGVKGPRDRWQVHKQPGVRCQGDLNRRGLSAGRCGSGAFTGLIR